MASKNSKRKSKTEVAEQTGPPKMSWVRESVASLAGTFVLVFFCWTFVAQAYEIPSESMETTLLVGDRVFVGRTAYAPRTPWISALLPREAEIHRGDIIVFKHPGQKDRLNMVKRVIGVPGDRIRLINGQVMVNGHALDEGYAIHLKSQGQPYDNFPGFPPPEVYERWREWSEEMPKHIDRQGWLVVPPGNYFAMGDNRNNSADSRYWGFVPRENIIGRPLVLFWSIDQTSAEYQVTGVENRIIGFVQVLLDLPNKIRWKRLFLTFPRTNST